MGRYEWAAEWLRQAREAVPPEKIYARRALRDFARSVAQGDRDAALGQLFDLARGDVMPYPLLRRALSYLQLATTRILGRCHKCGEYTNQFCKWCEHAICDRHSHDGLCEVCAKEGKPQRFNLCSRCGGWFEEEDVFVCPNCKTALCSYCARQICESVDAPDGQFVDAYCPECGRQIAKELYDKFALDWEYADSDLRERSAMEGK